MVSERTGESYRSMAEVCLVGRLPRDGRLPKPFARAAEAGKTPLRKPRKSAEQCRRHSARCRAAQPISDFFLIWWHLIHLPEEAREAVAALLRADPGYEPGPPPKFARLVEEIRRAEVTVQTSSVSKTAESLREAPATVVVVTGEEIERRGYLDLEELLYDLPVFDVSRSNGAIYSSFYMRGFRSNLNDR